MKKKGVLLKKEISSSKPRITKQKTKRLPAKGLEDDEQSDLDLAQELDQEDAINQLQEQEQPAVPNADSNSDTDSVLPPTSYSNAQELLEGFSSDSDVVDPPLPPIPTKPKSAKKSAVPVPSTPGTVYLGHLPHGFFEPQMSSYFSQFGTVTRLRLSRNRKTGRSKHYAWVEFASTDVARVVAETMDGYLIPPQRMVAKVVENVDERVWRGANKVFKTVPWRRLYAERLEGKRSRERWDKLVRREEGRERKRTERIRELGIEYEGPVRGEKRKAEETQEQTEVPKEAPVKKGKSEKIPNAVKENDVTKSKVKDKTTKLKKTAK
jgi:nucleolar protein 15